MHHTFRVRLTWSNGHIWRATLPKSAIAESFEFKFVIRDDVRVVRWEGNPNHRFNLREYILQFSQPAILEALRDGGQAQGVANLTFPDSTDMVSYDRSRKLLSFYCPWRS